MNDFTRYDPSESACSATYVTYGGKGGQYLGNVSADVNPEMTCVTALSGDSGLSLSPDSLKSNYPQNLHRTVHLLCEKHSNLLWLLPNSENITQSKQTPWQITENNCGTDCQG